jgi:hypothetical protein
MNEPSLSGCASVTAALRLRNRTSAFLLIPAGWVARWHWLARVLWLWSSELEFADLCRATLYGMERLPAAWQ